MIIYCGYLFKRSIGVFSFGWCGSVIIYCGYLFKRSIGVFSFGWFLISILKWFSFCDRRAKDFKVLKYLFVNIFVLLLIEK